MPSGLIDQCRCVDFDKLRRWFLRQAGGNLDAHEFQCAAKHRCAGLLTDNLQPPDRTAPHWVYPYTQPFGQLRCVGWLPGCQIIARFPMTYLLRRFWSWWTWLRRSSSYPKPQQVALLGFFFLSLPNTSRLRATPIYSKALADNRQGFICSVGCLIRNYRCCNQQWPD